MNMFDILVPDGKQVELSKSMACQSSVTAENWTDDDVLDYWDDPKNRDHIINAVPIDKLSAADVISDYFQEFNQDFVSQVLKAVPSDFMSNYDYYIKMIDDECVVKLIKEKDTSKLKSYFNKVMKEHPLPTSTAERRCTH